MSINQKLKADDILQGRTAKSILQSRQILTDTPAQDILQGRTAKDFLKTRNTQDLLATSKTSVSSVKPFEYEEIDYSGFDKTQSKDHLTKQLNSQLDYYSQKGYNYPHQKDINFITDQMTYMLSEVGVQDIRQLGYKETPVADSIVNVIKKGNKFYTKYDQYDKKEIDPRLVTSTVNKGAGMYGSDTTTYKGTVKNEPVYTLINKETGEELKLGKYQGALTKYPGGEGFKWGNTTRTEGMTDFMIQFDKSGNPLIYPTYTDTATDLSGVMTLASVAMMGYPGLNVALGNTIAGQGASLVAKQAIGSAVINGTIAEVTGGDFFKAALTSAATPYMNAAFDSAFGNTLFNKIAPNMPSSVKRVVGSTIKNSVTQGVSAAISGGNIGDAMYKGAFQGAVAQGTTEFTTAAFTNDNLSFITNNTNLSSDQVFGLASLATSRGVGNLIEGNDFFDGVTEGLLTHGISTSVTNEVVGNMKNDMNPMALDFLTNTSYAVANLFVNAAVAGKQVSPEMIQKIILDQTMGQVFTQVKS